MKISRLLLLSCITMNIALLSCSGEDGTDGAIGADGISCWDINANGINDAEEDKNGDQVFNGLDCVGQNGANGQDGNANVQKITVDVSQIAMDETNVFLDVPEMTNEILQNYVPIFYLEAFDENDPSYIAIPGGFRLIDRSYDILYSAETVQLRISNFDRTDTNNSGWSGSWDFLHIVLIEISPLQGKSSEDVMKTLKVEDYHKVMQYFGLEE